MTTQSSRTETALERHRWQFIENGCRGPMLRLEDLTADEKMLVNRDLGQLAARMDHGDLDALYRIYVQVLHSWGIICPHPQSYRTYGEERLSFQIPPPVGRFAWFRCELCETSVIEKR